MIHLIITAADI